MLRCLACDKYLNPYIDGELCFRCLKAASAAVPRKLRLKADGSQIVIKANEELNENVTPSFKIRGSTDVLFGRPVSFGRA